MVDVGGVNQGRSLQAIWARRTLLRNFHVVRVSLKTHATIVEEHDAPDQPPHGEA